ncbi:glycoside hydrolase family 99-like domain-containing protein [Acidocella sp.]|uniref:glycoside hydrolase family 99-like domain-containing protein n=1 Tax=Acidocella sp. TaxID=50710 RepID=UPI00261E592B|nr:glycoside hydrolase family 99-like domain-containing protein [Acidocella sp.]
MSSSLQAEIHAIRASGLFFFAWYTSQRPALTAQGADGVEHFCLQGWREGARPNPYFDPAWYLTRYPEVATASVNPLLHYIAFGEAEGRDPSPWFHTLWYRETYHLAAREPALKHYLARRLSGQVNPVPLFDAAWYLDANKDVAAGQADPFEHFCSFGAREGRDPSPEFDVKFYTNRYGALIGGQNPLLHYLTHRDTGLFLPKRPEQEGLIPVAVKRATRPAAHFEEVSPAPAHAPRRARLLAFYLPQFHPIPENDAWWGKGFTDWTNLARALPRFVGHLQPRVPRDLGFYSLEDPRILPRQIALAKGAGLEGFVFYSYWFNGHTLLETPLARFMADKSLEFGFCAMWANENWTRRWDGLDSEILIAQDYLERDDDALIAHFAAMFADPRYIRVQNRPLLMLYRPGLIPDARRRIRKWREIFKNNHQEAPLLVMAQSLSDEYDPTPYGLDGAVEFPPHKLSQSTPCLNATLDLLDQDFDATVHDYADIAETSLRLPPPAFPLIKTIVPSWDNDPRREGKGLVIHGSTPAKYQAWLEKLIDYSEQNPFHGERLVCINAWNEWAEGAYLEPDLHSGGAYLNATARAVVAHEPNDLTAGLLLVGHDAAPHGAQMLLLNLARQLARRHGVKIHVLLLGVGQLLGKYFELGDITIAYVKSIITGHLDQYQAMGVKHAIVNSAVSARVVPWLEARGIRTTLLVHELPQALKHYKLEIESRAGAEAAATLVFSSRFGAERFLAATTVTRPDALILPQGNYHQTIFSPAARAKIRHALGLDDQAFLILGLGYGDIRKGFDLFLQLARRLGASRGDVHCLWVGDIDATLHTYLEPEMAALTEAGYFTHLPFTTATDEYVSAADILALPSREDPLPTVVMEALCAGTPVVAFEGAGGTPDLLRAHQGGLTAPAGDLDSFQAALTSLLNHPALGAARPRLAAQAAAAFDFDAYSARLLHLAMPGLKSISVAVLNYNYARHLPARLESIFAQTYPVSEVLLLDDASRDHSLTTARETAARAGRSLTILENTTNQGVFAQWRRAAEAATGEYIWLAEADDLAHPTLLARLAAALDQASAPLLAFADSQAIDDTGAQVMPDYKSYYFESGAQALLADGLWPARDFAAHFLTRRNLIPNVSAVLWRRAALLKALEATPDLESWSLAGDWRLYLALLTGQTGEIAYVSAPLNIHRRHAGGITHQLSPADHIAEIARAQAFAAQALGLDQNSRKAQAADLARVAERLNISAKRPVARRRKF